MTTPSVPQKPPSPVLELPPGLDVTYANLARIAHSPSDIVIDFAHILPGEPTAKVRSRVVMTPLSVKLLVRALTENLARYEAAFGEINMPVNSNLADNLFKPFQPPAEPPKEA
jgi:hypothetical protein